MSDYRALILTDVVDSTLLSERLGNDAMAEVWAAHDRVARDLLHKAGGREIDKTDGMLMMFDHASDAVDFALAYHNALAALPVPLCARAGLHVGPVILRENSPDDVARGAKPLEVDGIAKPTAARVMAIARGGQLLMTALAREALGKTKLRVVSHGHWQMKGLTEPLELFEANDYEARFDPPTGGDKARRVVLSAGRWVAVEELPGNLPQQLTSFVGRERELREVEDLLGKVRLLTLVGMGGLGKTRLSLQAAFELRHRYPDGTWFIDLAPVRDGALVAGETAQTLGVREESGRLPLETLCAFLKSRQLLLILDNCEHVSGEAARLADAILRAAPQVHILASSRESLQVVGEQVYPVPTLPMPARNSDLQSLRQSTAVRLFVERVRLQRPAFELTENDAPIVAELVARLEGIPLALELAAARTRMLSLADINTRLKNRYKLLTGGGTVTLERQQTLRALVDWSYDLLHDHERLLLGRLSVFVGGFDLGAAEQVCGLAPIDIDDVLDLLGSLANKSMLLLEDAEEATRFRMLETIRDYAREKLEQSGEEASLRARHCEHYFGVAKSVRDGIHGADQGKWIERAEIDLDNLRAAIALSLQGNADPFLAVKFAVALQVFWTLRGYVNEGREIVRAALELPAVQASDMAHAHALYVGAALAYCQGDHARARQMLETCLALRRRIDDPISVAGTLSTLSMARLLGGDAAGAAEGEREALELFRRSDERRGQALCLLHLGQIALFRDEAEEAAAAVQASIDIARDIRHREIEGECELVSGEIAFEAGLRSAAIGHFERSLAICTEAADRRGEARATWWLGRVDLDGEELASARTRLGAALLAFQSFEMREDLLLCLEDHAMLALAFGAADLAARLAGHTVQARERMRLPLPPRHARRAQRRLQAIESALDPQDWRAAIEEGRALDLDAAIRSARSQGT